MTRAEVTRVGAYGITLFKNSILLVRQMKGPLKDLLDLPGGGVEPGETPDETLKREFLEEVAGQFQKSFLVETIFHTHDYPEMLYHLTAHIYLVKGFAHAASYSHPPELLFDWYSLKHIENLKLTPVANRAISQYLIDNPTQHDL